MTAINEQKMDKGSSTCSSYNHMTDECRSARNKISAARELYHERIQQATKGDINDLDTSDEENTFEFTPQFESTGQLTVLKEKSQSYSTKEAEFKQQEEDTSDEENTFEFTPQFESTGQLTVLKGSRQKIGCKRAEMLMILEYYQVHSGNYDSIVNDIFNRRSELPEDAAELYSETPKFMLRSRVRNQIYLFPSKKKYIRDEELNWEYYAVCKMQEDASKGTEQSNTTAPLTKDKRVDGAAVSEVPEAEFNDETKKYKYPFENLVLQGGGMKGIAYCGLIKVLEEHGILQQMKRFAGTSAGAITAALLAVGYNSYDAEKILGVDFEKLVCDSSWLKYPLNLYRGYGVNTGKRFDRFIGDLLALKTGNPDVTFEEVYKRFTKELCLVVVNVDTNEEMYCHVKTTPQMPVRLAVCMSMSIPGLFQAVKYKHSYFVDGGLLCNYPIHCFDGWFLSMEKENTFFKKMQSLNDLQMDMGLENRFKHDSNNKTRFEKDPKNKTTIGGIVYCDGENISYRQMLEQSTGVPLGKLPDTALARKYAKGIAYDRKVKEIYEETGKAVIEFYKVLRDNEHKGRISRDNFMDAFNEPSFIKDYKTLLFGDGCDSEKAWVAVNKYGRDEVQFTDITSFIESTRVSMLETFKDYKGKDTSHVLALSGAMILGLSESTMPHFLKSTDVERSVGINTWYVQATNFKLEEGDKQFLTNQGRDSTKKFLQNFLENNNLEKLTGKEMHDIPTSVGKRKLEKIIEGECTMSSTLTTIVIASTTVLLLCGLLYVAGRQNISRTTQ